MSLALMVKVMTLIEVSRPQQAVLLAMAEHAADDGSRCFPSTDLIAWKLGYKPRAVTDIIRSLRRASILVEVAPATQHRPTEYRIDLDAAPPKLGFDAWKAQHGRHQERSPGVQSHVSRDAVSRVSGVQFDVQGCNLTSPEVQFHVNGARENAPEPLREPLENINPLPPEGEETAIAVTAPEPSPKRQTVSTVFNGETVEVDVDEVLETIWTRYPRRTSKAYARRVLPRALRKASLDTIFAGLNRDIPVYAGRERQHIPHLSTWLNQERWNDESC